MPKKKSQDKDAALAETMLRDLESLRQEGSGAYPPKLAELARLSGQSPSDEQVQRAAKKKAFTAKAVVIEKVDKKPSLDSPVYIKGDEPAKKKTLKRAPAKRNRNSMSLNWPSGCSWFWNPSDGWEPRPTRRCCGGSPNYANWKPLTPGSPRPQATASLQRGPLLPPRPRISPASMPRSS